MWVPSPERHHEDADCYDFVCKLSPAFGTQRHRTIESLLVEGQDCVLKRRIHAKSLNPARNPVTF